jgi:hypothetical protein
MPEEALGTGWCRSRDDGLAVGLGTPRRYALLSLWSLTGIQASRSECKRIRVRIKDGTQAWHFRAIHRCGGYGKLEMLRAGQSAYRGRFLLLFDNQTSEGLGRERTR